MIRFPRIAICTCLLLCAPAPLMAQDQPKGEEEKKKEEGAESQPRRGGFGQGRYGGMGGDWSGQVVEFLKGELDLDSKQEQKVKDIMSTAIQDAMKNMGQFWQRMGEGGGNMEEAGRKAFEDVRVNLTKKISEVLTPAQKREFEVLVEQFDRRAQNWEQQREAWQEPAELFNPKPISKRLLLAKAERSLFLGPDETAVIMPYIGRVIDARHALYEGRKVRRADLRNAISGGASKDEIEQRMSEIRAAEQFQELEKAAGEAALRELLTIDQEARFVAMEILD